MIVQDVRCHAMCVHAFHRNSPPMRTREWREGGLGEKEVGGRAWAAQADAGVREDHLPRAEDEAAQVQPREAEDQARENLGLILAEGTERVAKRRYNL